MKKNIRICLLLSAFSLLAIFGCDDVGVKPMPQPLNPSVSAGGFHSMSLKEDSTLWTWGGNFSGEFGDGTTTGKKNPQLIGTDYVAISAGDGHSLAIMADGTLWAWGD